MPVDRNLWRRAIRKAGSPRWPCPGCPTGTLKLRRETLVFHETTGSLPTDEEGNFDPYGIIYAFSALLECENCRVKIACSGEGGEEIFDWQDEEGSWNYNHEPALYPRYFSRPMPILRLKFSVPENVKDRLLKSFLLIFADSGAAANYARQCSEEILSDRGVPKMTKNGGYMSLETRIKKFEGSDSANANRISALRWIGNFGSHSGPVKFNDVLNAYDILEILLEDLYFGHYRSTQLLIDRINRERRP